jgi:UDP-N-acetylmuramoylalanine--D-glutamate ligase
MEITNLNLQQNQYQQMIQARLKMQGDDSHHLETILHHKNITWINHSIATSVEMTWFALRDVEDPVLLIMGGIDRADDHEKLCGLMKEKVHTLICIGSTPWKYFNAYRNSVQLIVQASDLEEAVVHAGLLAPGVVQTVLFSPSCPSYDAFDNYKNRGDAFRKFVLEKIK